MSISTLVVGLGGTGVLTLRYLKDLYDGLPAAQRVPVGFLGIDFDRNPMLATGDGLAPLEDHEFLYLQAESIHHALRNLDRSNGNGPAWKNVLDWFPDQSKVEIPRAEIESNGASQFRIFGRLGFFQNDEQIASSMRTSLSRLPMEIQSRSLTQPQRVVLVASVAGGTGSGMLLDMAYLARQQLSEPRVYAYLLLPEAFDEVDHGGRTYPNSYACLKELAYLKDQQIPFVASYYRIPPLEVQAGAEEPFARIFLFSRRESVESQDMVQSACLQIAHTILAPLQRTIQEKSLAVNANAIASSSEEEQRRRRTHCFSVSGSSYVDLSPVRTDPDQLLQAVVSALRDPDFLSELFTEDLPEMVQQTVGRLDESQLAVVRELRFERVSGAAGEGAADELADPLAQSWKERIRRASQKGVGIVMNDLAQATEYSRKNLVEADDEEYRSKLGLLVAIALSEYDDVHYEENLGNLKRLPSFNGIEDSLHDEVKTMLLNVERFQSAKESLQRRAFYQRLRKWHRYFRFPESSSPGLRALREQVAELTASEARARRVPRLLRLATDEQIAAQYATWKCEALAKALEEEVLRKNLEAILQVRANKRLFAEIETRLAEIDNQLREATLPIREIRLTASIHEEQADLPGPIRDAMKKVLRRDLDEIVDEASRLQREIQDPGERAAAMTRLIQERILSDDEIRNARFIVYDQERWQQRILEAIARAQQKLFERRTPNPQRKGFGLILVPEGLRWPGGVEKLTSFLKANAQQVLNCRCEVVPYHGEKIWIYYEDLFNPPDHIQNVNRYYASYAAEGHRELFHTDRRMLEMPIFQEINSGVAIFKLPCGNDGCDFNIAHQKVHERICRGCLQPIRSRCGNPGCSELALHRHPSGRSQTCPGCGGVNHAAWWICPKHGKAEYFVPIDVVRCPRCIDRHQRDRQGYPVASIGVRPDLQDSIPCPRCTDIAETDPDHPIFFVREALVPFYRNGVYGQQLPQFERVARQHGLPENCLCPQCRTFLIPVHHHRAPREEAA